MRLTKAGKINSSTRKIRSLRARFRAEIQGAILASSSEAKAAVKKRMNAGLDFAGIFHESASKIINGDTGTYANSVYIIFPRGGSEYSSAYNSAQKSYVGALSRSRHAAYTSNDFQENVLPEVRLPNGGGIFSGGIASMMKYADRWESGTEGIYSPVFLPIKFDLQGKFKDKIQAIGERYSSRTKKL